MMCATEYGVGIREPFWEANLLATLPMYDPGLLTSSIAGIMNQFAAGGTTSVDG